MRKTYYLAMVMALTAMVGCQNENEFINLQNDEAKTFYATFENDADSRTALDESNNVLWSENDQISVFGGTTANNSFILNEGAGTTYGTFKVNSAAAGTESNGSLSTLSVNAAFYPYDSNVTISKNEGSYTFNATFPATQTYVESGTFGQGASPMVAVTESTLDANLKFKNVGAIFRLQLKGDATITKVVFSADANLAGVCEITASNTEVPSVNVTVGSKSITLNCGEGVALNASTPTNFVVAMLPVEIATGGITITIYDNAGKKMVYEHKASEAINIERSKAYTTEDVTYEGVQTAITTQEALTTALSNAASGTPVVVDADIELTESLNIDSDKELSLDLNGNTLTFNAGTASTKTAAKGTTVGILNAGNLSIENGNIVYTYGTGSAITNNGTLTLKNTNVTSSAYCVYTVGKWEDNKTLAEQGTPIVKTTITGGNITSNWSHADDTHTYALYCSDNALLTVKNATVEGDGAIFVTCANVELDNVTTNINCSISAACDLYLEAAAKATVTNCTPSIVRAYDKWNNKYGVITYNDNVMTAATQSQQMTIPEGVQVTLEGNNTYGYPEIVGKVVNSGNLTLANVSVNYTESTGSAITNNGTLTLKNTNVTSSAYCVYTVGKWEDNKTLAEQGTPIVKTTITGGNITSNWSHADDTHTYALYCSDNALLTVKDAMVSGDGSIFVTCANVSLDNVTATANCSKKSACNLYLEAAANATVSDCKFSSTGSNVRAYDNWSKKYGVITYNNTEYCANAITEHPTGGYTTVTTN